ncbi:MAG: hypothetical protein U0002_19670 [Thermoanaerobaculia bacterium]
MLESSQYDAAVLRLSELESERGLSDTEQVAKGRAVLLSSEKLPLGLADAEQAFLTALDLNPNSIDSLLELGWYYYAYQDNPSRGRPYFEAACRALRSLLTEAARGVAGCLSELESSNAARAFLQVLNQNVLVKEELPLDQQELLEPSLGHGDG